MIASKRPQGGVGDVRPMDSGMQHHGCCNRHDGSNVLLGDVIVMVSSNTCESRELGGSERFRIVGLVFLRSDAGAATHSFEALFRLQSFVRVQMYLVLDKDVAGGVVNEDTTASVHVVEFRPSGGK